ncbi:glycosyltransferase [Puniceicoccaceae bacterium K14]|nr:glycosyltransferase [Puniceicoccaceae bacterium K14]
MSPLVSICLPNLNKISFLRERLQSISSQTYQNWECIVCDGQSDDGSFELLKNWADSDSRISLFSLPRIGIYPSWNACIEKTKGDYVYIATSDDSMSEDCLEILVKAMEANPKADWCHFPVKVIDQNGNTLGSPLSSAPASHYYGDWMTKLHLRSGKKEAERMCCLGSIYLSVTGLFFRNSSDLRFPKQYEEIGDFFYYLSTVQNKNVLYMPEPLATWRMYGNQATRPTSLRLKKQLRYLKEFIGNKEESKRPEFIQLFEFRQYSCHKQIIRIKWGKLGQLVYMLTHRYGRKELGLILKSSENPEQLIAQSLIDRNDIVEIPPLS